MEKNKNLFLILNIILFVAIWIGDMLYSNGIGGLLAKSLTSALFVILGVCNLVYLILGRKHDLKFPIIMVVGLFFAMLGDIVLNVHFISGAILFAIGHVFYFVSYCFLLKFHWVDLIYGAVIFVPSVLFITLAPIFNFGEVLMEVVCVVYAIIISCMVGKAFSNFIRQRNLQTLLLAIGSLLFYFSDLMLLLNVFAGLPKVIDILCLATYYPAQCILVYSILKTQPKEEIEVSKENKKD